MAFWLARQSGCLLCKRRTPMIYVPTEFFWRQITQIFMGEPFAGQDWGQKKAFLHGAKSRTERFHILHITLALAVKCNVVWLSNYSLET